MPATAYLQSNLASNAAGVAPHVDPNLVNPWGLAINPGTGAFWAGDNVTGVSTLYDTTGTPFPPGAPLVVTNPPPAGHNGLSSPTGTVFNGTNDFVIRQGAAAGPATFLFVTEDGTISGWNQDVNPTQAILEVDRSAGGAVYKGLALGNNGTGNFIYAANFSAGTVDVFDRNFAPVQLAGGFTDSTLPAGFAPFNVANIGGQLFVAYAKQDATKRVDVGGAGNGFIDVFDTNGNFLKRFASQGTLNSPWGMVAASANFGDFSNDILVGNFKDGHISAFTPDGAFVGQVSDASGSPIVITSLWGLTFGGQAVPSKPDTLFFTAGARATQTGQFGSLQVSNVPPPPPPVNAGTPLLAIGADAGGGPQVKVYDATTNALRFQFFAYDPGFTGGVRVAVGDVTGDGVADIVTAPGPGGGPDIHVYDGQTGALVRQFFAYDPHFTGGVFVAAGDVTGDRVADIICGADAGGGPNITVFNGKDGSRINSFFAFDSRFTGGVRVAAGNLHGNGIDTIIAGAGPGGGPNVTLFDPVYGGLIQSFFAYDQHFTAGIYVAAADVNGDGRDEILTGAGPGGGPNVSVFSEGGALLKSFFPYDPAFTGGVRVTGLTLSGQPQGEIVSVPGPGGGPDVRIVNGASLAQLDDFFVYDPHFTGGLFVAASR